MNKVTQTIIDSLTETTGEKVLSLYVPMHKEATAATAKVDQARYRTIVSKGLEQWESQTSPDNIKLAKQTLEATANDIDFWKESRKSLAIFASSTAVEFVSLPLETSEYVFVGDSFDLAPLKVAYSQEQPFYLLALAKHHPKLFRGDSYGLEAIDIDFPDSPEDALNIDEMFSGSNTVRGVGTKGGGNDMLSTHGQGDSNHAGQEEHLKYLRIIDNKIIKTESIDSGLPLVLAATETEASDFKHISNYPHLLSNYVPGNHTVTAPQQLHQLAWDVIVSEITQPKVTALVDRFNEGKGVQKASSDLDSIAEAVAASRVDVLLLGILEKTNDSVSDSTEPDSPLIRLQETYLTNRMCELVNEVSAQGGAIVGVDPELLATPTMVGALYRY